MITRPNGKPYRPRNTGLRAHAWEGEDDCGVVVFGTLDPDRARPLAAEVCAHWYGMPVVLDPAPGWYRDGFQYGERRWIRDEERGAPGVMFRAVDAPLDQPDRRGLTEMAWNDDKEPALVPLEATVKGDGDRG